MEKHGENTICGAACKADKKSATERLNYFYQQPIILMEIMKGHIFNLSRWQSHIQGSAFKNSHKEKK
jgi:hypothetical protein